MTEPSPAARSVADRIEAALLAAAVGDALGAPYEFTRPAAPPPLPTGYIGGGAFNWSPGETTDDTDMTLAVSEAIGADGGRVQPATVLAGFLRWFEGRPRDIGHQTARALAAHRGAAPDPAPRFAAGEQGLGNGSLMRTAPVGLAHAAALARADAAKDEHAVAGVLADLTADARAVSAITHDHPVNNDACAAFSILVAALAAGRAPDDALALARRALAADPQGAAFPPHLEARLHEVADRPNPADLWPLPRSGYVLDTLRSGLWAALVATPDTAWPGLALLATGGDDSDTHATVAAAALGARFGLAWLPAWCLAGLCAEVGDGGRKRERVWGSARGTGAGE